MKTDAHWKPHVRQYIHVDDKKKEFSQSISGSDSDAGYETSKYTLWAGYYRLNLGLPGNSPGLGWIAGSGRREFGESSVDFLLTENRSQHRVHGRHARFMLNHASCDFIIATSKNNTVIVDGKEEVTGDQRVLRTGTTAITMGELTYKLVLSEGLSAITPERLRGFRRNAGLKVWVPDLPITPTPFARDYMLQQYIIKQIFAEGSTCVVHAGVDRNTGATFAVKKIKRNDSSSAEVVSQEIKIQEAIGQHVSKDNCPGVSEMLIQLFSRESVNLWTSYLTTAGMTATNRVQ